MINIFNEENPVCPTEFGEIISRGNHQLVIPFSLISELVPADNSVLTVLRRLTKIEEDIPHVFLQQHRLLDDEIRSAVSDHLAGLSPMPHDPYVNSFHELWGCEFEDDPIFLMDVDRTIGARKLSRQVEMMLQKPEVFHWSEEEASRAVKILEDEQVAIKSGNAQTQFFDTAERWIRRVGLELEPRDLAVFGSALRKNPRIAPGWRLYMEVFDQLVRDKAYKPTVNDVWDLANVMIVPYVDAATLDKNKIALVERATRRLQVFDPTLEYNNRVFASAGDVLDGLAA